MFGQEKNQNHDQQEVGKDEDQELNEDQKQDHDDNEDQEEDEDPEPSQGINLVTDNKAEILSNKEQHEHLRNEEKSEREEKSIEKGLFDHQSVNNKDDDESKDSIEEYEKIISEKLERKRKEELKKASENMKFKLVKTGRCPICTLSPPCNHYNDEDEVKTANRRLNQLAKQKKNGETPVSPYKSPRKVIIQASSNRPVRKKIVTNRKAGKDRLNKTVYNTDKGGLEDQNKLSNKSDSKKDHDEDSALPIIRDEDFDKSEHKDNNEEENNNQVIREERQSRKPNANAIYKISRRKRSRVAKSSNFSENRLHSQPNKTKVRIQGRHGVRSEKYVDIERSINENINNQERRRFIIKAHHRHKIQEQIEKYREEKIQREIELLEEAKRLEAEERHRERVREERR